MRKTTTGRRKFLATAAWRPLPPHGRWPRTVRRSTRQSGLEPVGAADH